jgi:ribonucleoside-diphosphate reductase beta chain
MGILDSRDYFKPFSYPWAYEAYKKARSMAWEPHEAPMAEDINDWNKKLTENEKSLLTQLFRFFTQADIDIAKGYFEKYAPRFPHPEIRMMFGAFIDMEANHIDAYSTLIDTLGLPESEYKAFQEYAAMRNKHEFMFENSMGKGIADLAVDIAIFSAFGEGMQLFSSFAILLSFQKRGLMKGMSSLVEWSLRDESLHVEAMIKLFHTLVQEHPRVWNDETKQRIYETCRQMVKLEDAFIDQAFSIGPVDGITPDEAKKYIRYIADRRLLQLGLKPNYRVKDNPLPWLDWIMNAPTHTNFFESRSTEYGKGEIEGWNNAFDFIDMKLQYKVYTMPGCPHCDRAVQALTEKKMTFTTELVADPDKRAQMKAELEDWETFPLVFRLALDKMPQFIGGADDLIRELQWTDIVEIHDC